MVTRRRRRQCRQMTGRDRAGSDLGGQQSAVVVGARDHHPPHVASARERERERELSDKRIGANNPRVRIRREMFDHSIVRYRLMRHVDAITMHERDVIAAALRIETDGERTLVLNKHRPR